MNNKNKIRIGFVALALCFTSCVSMKNYRDVKSQMLSSEIEIARLNAKCDSLQHECQVKDNTIKTLKK